MYLKKSLLAHVADPRETIRWYKKNGSSIPNSKKKEELNGKWQDSFILEFKWFE